jgi:hypothetical protein
MPRDVRIVSAAWVAQFLKAPSSCNPARASHQHSAATRVDLFLHKEPHSLAICSYDFYLKFTLDNEA